MRSLFPSVARVSAVSFLFLAATTTHADEGSAKAYLDAARDDIKNGNFDSVGRTLELMGEQFEGVPEATQAKFTAEGEALKKEAAEKKFVATFDEAEKKLKELEKDKDIARAVASYKTNPQDENAQANVRGAAETCQMFERETIKPLPAGHARTKAINERYEKFAAPIAKLALAGERQTLLDRLKAEWKSELDAHAQNTAPDPAAPEYKDWLAGTEVIVAQRSLDLAERATTVLNRDHYKSFISAFADDAEVGAVVKEIRGAYEAGSKRVMGDAALIVDAAEKAKPDGNAGARLGSMQNQLERLAGANGQPELAARITALTEKWQKGETAAREVETKQIEANAASASAMWPAIVEQYAGQTVEIDAGEALKNIDAFKGKLIRFEDKANVATTQFGAPDFAYVATVNGKPFAFKFSPKAAAAAQKYADWGQRPIGSGEFRDVIGRVSGVGTLNVLSKNTITDQYEVIGQVEAPFAEIVAFRSQYVTFDENKGSNVDALK